MILNNVLAFYLDLRADYTTSWSMRKITVWKEQQRLYDDLSNFGLEISIYIEIDF